jgi:hypothetical protein
MKMNFKGMGLEDVDWIHLAADRGCWRALVNTVMNRMLIDLERCKCMEIARWWRHKIQYCVLKNNCNSSWTR